MEQSSGRSWDFVGVSREVGGLRDGTLTNKEKPFQARKNLSKQGKTFPSKGKPFQTRKNLSKQGENTFSSKGKIPFKQGKSTNKQGKTFQAREKHQQTRKTPFEQGRLSSKGYLPIKCRSLQVVGVFRQGKAVVSDGGYGVIGGRYCLLVWGDAEGTKGKRWR